jgi:peptide/nickel transport system substrate-binding protein
VGLAVTRSTRLRRRRGGLLPLLLAFTLLAAACASVSSGSSEPSGGDDDDADAGPPQYGGSMTYGLEAETTNGWCLPEGQLAIAGIQVARSIYDTLTVPDANGEFQPFLAQSVTPNADYTEWTIRVRDDVTFHDGTPLDAQVVANNLSAYRGDYPGRSSLLFLFVLGDIVDTVPGDGRVDGITVQDELTLTVQTSRPWVSFPSFLYSSGRMGIMAQAQLDDAEHCDTNLIGTGPFELDDWQVNSHMRLTRNPDYWRTDEDGNQLPYLDEIEFRPIPEEGQRVNGLRSGELDAFHLSSITGSLIMDEMRALDEAEQVNLIEEPPDFMEVGFLMMNVAEPPFDDIRVREAVALALDGELSNEIFSKSIPQLANGPFAPGAMGYVEDSGFETNDPERARQLVQEYEEDTGEQVEFVISSGPTAELLKQIRYARNAFEDVGMTVRISTLEQSALIQTAIEGGYQMITFRNYPGFDPDNLYVWWYDANTNPVNFPNIADPEVDRLLDAGRTTADRAEREQIYEDLNRRLNEQHYFLWTTWAIWSIPMATELHGVVGARPVDESGASVTGQDYTGLAVGHDMALVWKEQ